MNGSRTQSINAGFRPASIVAMIAAVTAALVFVAVVAFGAGGGRGGNGGNGGVGGPSVAPSESPASPTPAPSESPSESPSEAPSEAPSDDPDEAPTERPGPVVTPRPTLEPDPGSDGMPIKVDLETENGADVYVDIVDRTGWLVGAESGTPAEGVSVEPYKVVVENVGENTLKLTWSDYPIDNALALYIDEVDGTLRLVLVQPEPRGPTDSVGSDRELILTFSSAVSADDVEAIIQDGLDTPG
jgi:hypothetical protein